jgi:hypothetical protein
LRTSIQYMNTASCSVLWRTRRHPGDSLML